MKVILPESYCEKMKVLLGEEYDAYIRSFEEESSTAIRVNTGKISLEEWQEMNPFSTRQVPFNKKGFYYDAIKDTPSKHPYYFAGLYYIQEPSAMIPAMLLPIEKGDCVLDLCAAPGGKATELGAKLNGTGLLVANDISVSRSMALAKNLQIAGIANVVVTAETPENLRSAYGQFFDKIVIDAPCSGEGMFRREPRMVKDWLEKGPSYYCQLQKQILKEAYRMLKPGGKMVYSTCTFSVQEDEEVVQWLLDTHDDMEILPVERKEGFSEGRPDLVSNGSESLKHCVRIFPHKVQGEGHFAVLLHKKEEAQYEKARVSTSVKGTNELSKVLSKWKKELCSSAKKDTGNVTRRQGKKNEKNVSKTIKETDWEKMEKMLSSLSFPLGSFEGKNEVLRYFPEEVVCPSGIRVVYAGLPIGEWKGKFQFSPQLALTLKQEDFSNVINWEASKEEVIRYLKGETLFYPECSLKGNILVCVDGFGLGWCQSNGSGQLKNKYLRGWRYQ